MKTLLVLYTLLSASVLPAEASAKSDRLETSQTSQLKESLRLQLSEEVIAAGEELWFQALVSMDDTQAEPEEVSKVLYVEVLSSSQVVLQGIYSIKNGIGRGQIQIPDTLSGGWYQLRAYTQWMRNSGDYSAQPLLIVNPYEESLAVQQPAQFSFTKDVTFFPEGGNFIAGLPNRLLVQLSDEMMMDSITSTKVVSQQDSLPLAEVALESGRGIFTIIPEVEKEYMLEMYTSGDTLRQALPKPQPQGTTVQSQFSNEVLSLKLHHSERDDYTLILRDRDAVLYSQQYNEDAYTTDINTQSFPAGLLELLVLDKQQQVLVQRLVYHNPTEKSLDIKLDKETYQPREQVSAALSLGETDAPAQLAVTVRKVNPLSSYLQQQRLTSGLIKPEKIPATLSPSERTAWINQTLISKESLFPPRAGSSKVIGSYSREDESLTVSGKAESMNEKKIGGKVVVLSVPGRNPYFEYDFVEADGSFQIPIKENVIGRKDIILQMADTSLQVSWTLDDKFMEENTYQEIFFPDVPESVLTELQESYARRARIKTQYDLFQVGDSTATQEKKGFRFYGAPNFEIRVEDYIELPNFVEVNRELMPGIRLRENKGVYNLDVFDIPSRTFLPGEPSVFLDGVLIHDVNFLVSFPPREMERIETVNRRTYYGEYRFDGTIAIYTKDGDAYLPAISPSAKQAEMNLYSRIQTFSPIDTLPAHEPDFRTLLYWQPAVNPGNEAHSLTFNNADELGEFEIIVEGMTDKGRRIYGRKTYTVSLNDLP
ncbi:hypothetical protein WJR50_01960 [Catalinimonas sp. 4WD22]|uniref:hypothetical protein n=1 Tax=Catalinimonas locisalis TaxID=3133978 RepID=UPI0031019F65